MCLNENTIERIREKENELVKMYEVKKMTVNALQECLTLIEKDYHVLV